MIDIVAIEIAKILFCCFYRYFLSSYSDKLSEYFELDRKREIESILYYKSNIDSLANIIDFASIKSKFILK
jgi:hypothetical protein